MTAELLYKIADVINGSGTDYKAVVPEARHDYMEYEDGRLVKSACLVIRIMLAGKVRNHVSRAVWNIYENDISRVIRKICRRDMAFAQRMAKCEPSPRDVEVLIRRASFKSLKLKISNSPYYLYVEDKP